jgi:hypothetical protein
MKLRMVGAALAMSLSTAVVSASQNRPSFTGTWQFVADRSTPASGPALGDEVRIRHEADALVLELPTKEFVRTREGNLAPVADGRGTPMAYKTDGADHVMLPLNPMQSTGDRTSFNLIAGGKYRVSWNADSLVITGSDDLPVMSGGRFEFVHRLVTTTFSMSPDGTLLVVRVAERDPANKGLIAYGKTEQRSVYRRTL